MSRIDRFGIALALAAIAWLSGCDPNHHDAEEALGRGAVCQTFGDGNTWACIRDGDLWTCIAGGPNGRDILCAPAGIFGAGPERIPAGPVEVPR